MNSVIAEETILRTEIEQARNKIRKLESSLQSAVADLERESAIQARFDTLGEVCALLERLDELGGSELFLVDQPENIDMPSYVARLRERVSGYTSSIVSLQDKHDRIAADLRNEYNRVSLSQETIIDLHETEENRKNEFVIVREITEMPFRPMVMPWSKKGEDEKRLRRNVALAIIFSLLMWFLIPLINLPVPDVEEEIRIPERMAKLLKKQKPVTEPKKENQLQKQQQSTDKKQARKKAERSGLLAFKDNFTELMNIASEANLGANANVSSSGKQTNQAARNLVVARSSSISGISSASLSRNTGGAGKGMSGGVQFSRVESSIGIGDGGGDRPVGNARPSRTDEEIQIVFDRYKAALYRIYQRELRSDPTLQGNMVLRITIAPDGSVTMCRVESTDLKSASMPPKIVARVKRFQFGAKKGVSAMTILYPIDFLPAT